MIFRKENRSDTFPRQTSGQRRPAQPDEESDTNDFRFDSQDDAPEFASPTTSRDEPQATGRMIDGIPGVPSASSAATSYRPSWHAPDATTSVIASNANWDGTLQAEGSLHIHGRAGGELRATNDVYIAEGAQIDAQIFADTVIVAGMVSGRIEATSRLELLPSGNVAGDVKASTLIVHEGAKLSGQLRMESSSGGSSMASRSATRQRRSGS